MLKRFLAFMIAGSLVFESPLPVYTTEQWTENGMEETMEIMESSEYDTLSQEEISMEMTVVEETDVEEVSTAEVSETIEIFTEEMMESEVEGSNETEMETDVLEETTLEGEGEIYLDNESSSYTELKLGTVSIKDDDGWKWYFFTAPEEGYYNFKINSSSNCYVEMGLYDKDKNALEVSYKNLSSNFMEEGETIYLQKHGSSDSDTDGTLTLTIQKLTVINGVQQENGYYNFETDDYILSILPEAGYSYINIDASIKAKGEYDLDSCYNLVTRCRRLNGIWVSDYSDELRNDNNYQFRQSVRTEIDTEYQLTFILLDSSNTALALFEGNISLKTLDTDEGVIIHNVTATEDSITMDVETIWYLDCCYAPIDRSEDNFIINERFAGIINGRGEYAFTGLQPGTEYYFQFRGINDEVVFETRASTVGKMPKVEYSADITDQGELILKAEVSDWNTDTAWFRYEYTNALGERKQGAVKKFIGNNEDLKKSFTIEKSLTFSTGVLQADTKYDITMWIETDFNEICFPKEIKTVMTPSTFSTDQLKFNIMQDEKIETAVNYTIEIDSVENAVDGKLYYRQRNGKDSYSFQDIDFSKGSSQITGSINGLQRGAAYEFVLLLNGVKLEIIKTIGEEDIKLVQTGEGELNAFDLIRTYKIESEEELADHYFLRLYYLEEGHYSSIGNAIRLDAANGYQAEIKTATAIQFDADTDYDLKWELSNDSGVIYNLYETIHTKKANIKYELRANNYAYRSYEIVLDSNDIVNFENYELNLSGYVRKQGDQYYRPLYSLDLSNNNNYCDTFYVSGLEANMTYEVSLRTEQGVEYMSDVFTTPADTREVSVTEITVEPYNAIIDYVLTGDTGGHLYCYIREKGTENKWKMCGNNQCYRGRLDTFRINNIKDNTTYEYRIGFSPYDNIDYRMLFSKLENAITGEFCTAEDLRVLTNVKISTDDKSADVSALFEDNNYLLDSYIHFFYKEENSSKWISADNILSTSRMEADYYTKIEGLKADTCYEYAIVISERGFCSGPRGIAENKKIMGTFTTKEMQMPTSITLSQKQLTLNGAYEETRFEGYSKQTLKVKVLPETAVTDFIWSSNNENVATVSAEGVVKAKGIGTAVITVESAYDSTVKATCEVNVNNYVIGYETDESIYIFDSCWDNFGMYKNGIYEGFCFYEQDADGKLTELSEFNVTFDKAGIVSWVDGSLYGRAVGETTAIFMANGFKAALTLNVGAPGKGFGIIGFKSSQDEYPAIKRTDETGESYTLACTKGITYQAVGEITPKQLFKAQHFEWKSSDVTIAEVSQEGIITPKRAGNVVLTVTPHTYCGNEAYIQEDVKIALHITDLPVQGSDRLYALANVSSKLSDIGFPADWGSGWQWKYPDTPLVTNGVYLDNSYAFTAVYNDGDIYYPYETDLQVYIGKITGATVSENTAVDHKQVLEVNSAESGTDDFITIAVNPVYQGALSADLPYETEIPEVNGLNIRKNSDGTYDIRAEKKGTYTLRPVVKEKGTDKILAKTIYKVKAVEGKQVGMITLSTNTEGIVIKENTIIFKSVNDKKNFTLNAVVKDRNGNVIDTALAWKTTDKAVATVAAVSKANDHSANVTIKGEGHAVITVTAKDAAGVQTELNLEIQNHAPRVSTTKAKVNLAYDYEDEYGKQFASAGGTIEIVPVYGESVNSVKLVNESGKEMNGLTLEKRNGYCYLVKPTSIVKGTYNCFISVTTSGEEMETYKYPLKVTVTDQSPKVTAKMSNTINLFYTTSKGDIKLTIPENSIVDYIKWEDNAKGINNGFSMSSYVKAGKYGITVEQQNIKVANKKPLDTSVAKGTLTVKLRGYQKIFNFKNFTVKYNYKKPILTTKKTETNIIPSVGKNDNSFTIYNKTSKSDLIYNGKELDDLGYFDKITCDSTDIRFLFSGNRIIYKYSGTQKKKKITVTLDSKTWREPLKVAHTINIINPTAKLYNDQLTYNTAFKSSATTYVYLKDSEKLQLISFADIVIQGADTESQKLLDDDLLVIYPHVYYGYFHAITVRQSQADLMKQTVPDGTYKYKVTPYYEDPETGEKVSLNTIILKVKIVNKPITAKITPKGSLNLTYGAGKTLEDKKNIAVLVDPKFSNFGSGYSISSYKLVGEYSKYFDLSKGSIQYNKKNGEHYYITINEDDICRLKAGQSYKLAVEYTIKNSDGETYIVTSNTFTVKPKQTVPKVTVRNNNQTLYAAADSLSRSYTILVSDFYTIENASGSIDCNKDGKADITVSGTDSITVKITDRDAVSAKTYSIPVTVKLKGRDGVSKDAKVTVKVKVKR